MRVCWYRGALLTPVLFCGCVCVLPLLLPALVPTEIFQIFIITPKDVGSFDLQDKQEVLVY